MDYTRLLPRALRAIRCADVRSGILPPQSRLAEGQLVLSLSKDGDDGPLITDGCRKHHFFFHSGS